MQDNPNKFLYWYNVVMVVIYIIIGIVLIIIKDNVFLSGYYQRALGVLFLGYAVFRVYKIKKFFKEANKDF
ncbi:MAG: hypothetical protein ABI855_01775 [Bacteroidota bacterium]